MLNIKYINVYSTTYYADTQSLNWTNCQIDCSIISTYHQKGFWFIDHWWQCNKNTINWNKKKHGHLLWIHQSPNPPPQIYIYISSNVTRHQRMHVPTWGLIRGNGNTEMATRRAKLGLCGKKSGISFEDPSNQCEQHVWNRSSNHYST